jgi:hypothetical protein
LLLDPLVRCSLFAFCSMPALEARGLPGHDQLLLRSRCFVRLRACAGSMPWTWYHPCPQIGALKELLNTRETASKDYNAAWSRQEKVEAEMAGFTSKGRADKAEKLEPQRAAVRGGACPWRAPVCPWRARPTSFLWGAQDPPSHFPLGGHLKRTWEAKRRARASSTRVSRGVVRCLCRLHKLSRHAGSAWMTSLRVSSTWSPGDWGACVVYVVLPLQAAPVFRVIGVKWCSAVPCPGGAPPPPAS